MTQRENEVAELLAWGATKKEVAQKLYVSVSFNPRTHEGCDYSKGSS